MLIKNLFRYWTYQVFAPGTVLREKYESFKTLLAHDRAAHDHLAVLEDLYYNQKKVDLECVVKSYENFAASTSGMVDALLAMCPSSYWSLKDYFKKFDFYVRFMLAPPEFDFSPPFVLELGRTEPLAPAVAGKKAAVLNQLNRDLHLPVPKGFVITTRAFHYFMEASALRPRINEKLAELNIQDPVSLEKTALEIEEMILNAPVPRPLAEEIKVLLDRLQIVKLAMRSSAVKEDGQASFAGQYLSLMNMDVPGVQEGYKKVIASKYSARALSYRIRCGICDHDTPMAVLVLEMVDAGAAGVIYTGDVDDPGSKAVLIHSAWGLGGLLVDGRVSPDVIRVEGTDRIIGIKKGKKSRQLILDPDQGTRIIETPLEAQTVPSLDEMDILTLARWADQIQSHFKGPQDIEWCRDRAGRLFVLQSRPLRQIKEKAPSRALTDTIIKASPVCDGADTICRGAAAGPVFLLKTINQIKDIPENAVVAALFSLPEYVTAVHKMAGIIFKTGSTAGHFASIAREFSIPAIVGPDHGFDSLENGQMVTLDADAGRVYDGRMDCLLSGGRSRPRDDLFSKSQYMAKLKYVISFCAELKLAHPGSDQFVPEKCRSLHDIIRFAHETAIKEMFFSGRRKGTRKKGARQLISSIPMLFYLLDVGADNEAGVTRLCVDEKVIKLEHVISVPLNALFKGLAHPGICWDEAAHFDWESYDKIVMAGGIISADSPALGSYAVVSETYMNVNLRFGYHFVILDCMCTPKKEENYILFRFSGGGADLESRWIRAGFIAAVLERLGFMTQTTSDLIDAQLKGADENTMLHTLDLTGRLLGATKLMDMYLKDRPDIMPLVEDFMNGRYDFRSVAPGGE